MSEPDENDEIEKVFTLTGYTSARRTLEVVNFILAELLETYIEDRKGHSAAIAFDGFVIGKDADETWRVTLTVIAVQVFLDKVAEVVGRYR